jgi:hypothetical protein
MRAVPNLEWRTDDRDQRTWRASALTAFGSRLEAEE